MRFDWDPDKAAANARKHNVTFDEAATAFEDENALVRDDPIHSVGERRFVLIGWSSAPRLLVVVHCEREAGDAVRIISARAANPAERIAYLRQQP
ncbi:MAG: BrnT family toxin [Deltaproteobacteria bacterium]|nr:BrnT family toxin [Deltaproteobacteria bacterium]